MRMSASYEKAVDHQTPEPRTLGTRLHRLPERRDDRGTLSFAELGTHLPFEVKRYFLIYDVKPQETRGQHAHRALHQYMLCVHGTCSVVLDDGRTRDQIVLRTPTVAIHVAPMIWVTQHAFSPDAVMLVLASDVYDEADYLRDYDEFLRLVRAR